ncbi:MAG: uncharacterized protein QOG16_65 [Actinomycetota bacterium]|nr:uncharacterized protein [Actinomycetota bacterium]
MEKQTLSVICDGVRLAGGICIPDSPKGVVLLLHGIPSVLPPAPDDLGYPGVAERFASEGWAAAWIDMRAVRGSKGYFSIEGWVRDARAAIDAVRLTEGIDGLGFALIGSSAGGAVSCEVVARGGPVDALAMLAAPAVWTGYSKDAKKGAARIQAEAGMALSEEVLSDPAAWFAEFDRVTPEKTIHTIKIPTLIVHGTTDDVVPVEHARRLSQRAPRAELEIIDGAGHQLRRDEGALEVVFNWLDRVLARR